MNDLVQAHKLAMNYGRLDSICAAAMDLGTLLLSVGGKNEAKPLLTQARDGFMKLEQHQIAAQLDEMLQQIDSAA